MMYAFLKVISRKVFEPKNYCHSMENSSELDRIAQKIGINPDTFEKKEVHDYYINESVNILFLLEIWQIDTENRVKKSAKREELEKIYKRIDLFNL